MTSFDTSIRDTDAGFAEDIIPGAPTIVACGGIAGGLDMPPFEFFGMLDGWPVSKVFLRDIDQVWYQKGVRGIGGVQAVADYLRGVDTERMVFVGNSAGGFGALFFASLAGRGDVLAFSPQTYLDTRRRLLTADPRWFKQVRNTHRVPGACLDLVPAVNLAGQATVHYSSDHRLDRTHAERLRGLPGVTLVGHKDTDHALVSAMKRTGELAGILRDSLGITS